MTSRNESLRARATRVLSPSMFGGLYSRMASPLTPRETPQFFTRAEGTRLWDADGREYIDLLCALGPNLLGYGDPRIEEAAARQRALGDTMNGAAPVLVELAEQLVETISHADWALFAKNGIDVINAALLIARAQTGKRRVLVANGAYHGAAAWCTPITAGVLPEERAFRSTYTYNDLESLDAAATAAGDDLAAIFATASLHDGYGDHQLPTKAYAQRCRELCDRHGALLVIDEVRAGFRLARDCSWSWTGIQPDLSCWSKALANGYPLSALLGSHQTRLGASKAFITGTYWLEAVPMAAAIATLSIIRETQYLEHTVHIGQLLREGLDTRSRAHGFTLYQTGPVQMPYVLFADDPDMRLTMAFVEAMMHRGVYMTALHNMFICAAMTERDVSQVLEAADGALADLARRRPLIAPNPDFVRAMASPEHR